MKRVEEYVCEVTGVVFTDEATCLAHEAIYREKQERFEKLVNEFVLKIEEKYEIEVYRETLKCTDGLWEDLTGIWYDYRTISFVFEDVMTGAAEEFYVDSDPVGDGRFEWTFGETVDSMVFNFKYEREQEIGGASGFLTVEKNWNGVPMYVIDGERLDSILSMYEGSYVEIKVTNRRLSEKRRGM